MIRQNNAFDENVILVYDIKKPTLCRFGEMFEMNLKEKILEASYELFSSKGYSQTTVSDIIKMVGSSRGGFYHHFNSKEEILEIIVDEFIDEFSGLYNATIGQHTGSSTDLFVKIFSIFFEYKIEQMKDWRKLQKIFTFQGSHSIIFRIAREFEELTTKIYTKIIKKGIDQGEFSAKYPKALAGLWTREMIQLNRRVRKKFFQYDEFQRITFLEDLKFTENLINRELGLEGNTIEVMSVVLDYIKQMREQFALSGEES